MHIKTLMAAASLVMIAGAGCSTQFPCCNGGEVKTCECPFNTACDPAPWTEHEDGSCSYDEDVDAGDVGDAGAG